MKKSSKILYGILAIGPFVLVILGFILMFVGTFGAAGHGMMTHSAYNPFDLFLGINMFMMMFGILGFLVGFVVFLIHALNNPRLGQEMKVVWAVMMFFLGGIAPVIYYGIYIASEVGYGNINSTQATQNQSPPQSPPASNVDPRDITIV